MALIPAGVFQMGDPWHEGHTNERPVHLVYVSAFFIDRFEVTNQKLCDVFQWALERGLIGATSATVTNREGNPRELVDLDLLSDGFAPCQIQFTNGRFSVIPGWENHPAVHVTWYGAQAYCNYRSDMENLERCINFTNWTCDFRASGYRLPTEAEWEKAARGGLTGHHFSWPSYGAGYTGFINETMASHYQNWHPWHLSPDPYFPEKTNRISGATPVGYYDGRQIIRGRQAGLDMANGYGLYDMVGNVWEWCWDAYDAAWYSRSAATNVDCRGPDIPVGLQHVTARVIRGGGWGNLPIYQRVSCRHNRGFEPSYALFSIGFRCVRNAY